MLSVSIGQVLIGLIAIPVVYYFVFVWRPRYFSQMGVKGPFPWPFFGYILTAIRWGLVETNLYFAKTYGRVIGVFEGTNPMLLVSDPDILQQILVKDFHLFTNRRAVLSGDDVVENFLTSIRGDHWRHVRHLMTPTFSASKLKQMTADMNDCAKLLIDNLSRMVAEGKIIDMKDRSGEFTMDVIARTAFAIEIDTQKNPNSPFVIYAKKLFEFSFLRPATLIYAFFPAFKPILRIFGVTFFPSDAVNFFKDVALKTFRGRKENETGITSRTDFLQLMINAHNQQMQDENNSDANSSTNTNSAEEKVVRPNSWNRKGLTENEVVAQSILFLLAGFESTASTLSFATYCLAVNPECQDKLYKEVLAVVGDKTEIDYDTANKLVYMDQCLHETLRLYPPAIRTDRETAADTTIAGINIPKGLTIIVQIYALHYDPLLWPEPEKFDPERFTPEAVATHHPMQFMPFGYGPRMCMGMRLALLELKIALVHLVRNFRFVRCAETEVPIKLVTSAFLQPKNGIKLQLEKRI